MGKPARLDQLGGGERGRFPSSPARSVSSAPLDLDQQTPICLIWRPVGSRGRRRSDTRQFGKVLFGRPRWTRLPTMLTLAAGGGRATDMSAALS